MYPALLGGHLPGTRGRGMPTHGAHLQAGRNGCRVVHGPTEVAFQGHGQQVQGRTLLLPAWGHRRHDLGHWLERLLVCKPECVRTSLQPDGAGSSPTYLRRPGQATRHPETVRRIAAALEGAQSNCASPPTICWGGSRRSPVSGSCARMTATPVGSTQSAEAPAASATSRMPTTLL